MEIYTNTPYCLEAVGKHEVLLLDVLTTLEAPLLAAIHNEFWDERGWRVCGATSIALCSLLNIYTGIPFRKGGLDEHIEISTDIYEGQPLDHSYILYYTGAHEVMYIDPIAPLLWGGQEQLNGAIAVSCYTLGELRDELAKEFNLHRFTTTRYDEIGINILFGDDRPHGPNDYSDMVAAMHDPSALTGTIHLPSGRIMDTSRFWGERIRRVMQSTRDACPQLKTAREMTVDR